MFQQILSWPSRSVMALVVSLIWIGAGVPSFCAAQPGAGHPAAETHVPPAADKAAAEDAVDAPGGHHDKVEGPITWKTDLNLWTLIVFGIFVIILKVAAWGPLKDSLNAREHKIKSDIAHAEESRVKAEKMLAEYQSKLAAAQDEVLKTLAEARRDAEHTRQEILAQTERDVTATKERAIQEIERTKDAALEELFNHMAGTVANATERVLGRALTDADQDRLIGDALAEFSRGQAS